MKISKEIYILYYIYQEWGMEFCPFSTLAEQLKNKLSKSDILSACSTLNSWSLLDRAYGKVDDERVGSGWMIDKKYGTEYRIKIQPINLDEVEILR